ncbi:NADPH-Fe(3+) oxidoreductase subunit alpha [Moorella thermoacetica]|nr:NADPH-Fe(3+) oxidoreductase subunit alpha [Moorella thermoacetica]
MVNLTIDGQRVTAPEGMTILEVARENGIHIPTLCHHPKLRPLGYCRLCLVDIEGAAKPMTACNTPVAEGMVIRTSTPVIEEMRKGIIEMLLSLHPEDCLTCEKAGNCQLQNCAYTYGVKHGELPVKREELPVLKENPFIVRDYNKCIVCGRCVRACQEVQVQRVVDLVGKGSAARVGATKAGAEVSLEEGGCVFCGNCVQVCPVGALTEKAGLGQGREWEFKKVRSICSYCGVGCNLTLYVKDGKVVKVRGYENPEVNNGWLCVKGRFGFDYIHNPDRITRPLIREGDREKGYFREASWEEALALVSQKLTQIKGSYGSEALGFLCSAKCTNEENYLLQKLARGVLGTNNVDHCARL